jgi:hypothetical protein
MAGTSPAMTAAGFDKSISAPFGITRQSIHDGEMDCFASLAMTAKLAMTVRTI